MKVLTRRVLAVSVGVGFACATTIALPQEKKVRLNLASAFPTSLTLIGEAPVKYAKMIERASAGTLEIRVNEPGALVPALQAIQATGQGSVDAAWSNAGFFASDRKSTRLNSSHQ